MIEHFSAGVGLKSRDLPIPRGPPEVVVCLRWAYVPIDNSNNVFVVASVAVCGMIVDREKLATAQVDHAILLSSLLEWVQYDEYGNTQQQTWRHTLQH